jgi:serine/threonine protein kinase/WD40 repeat protein
LPTSKFPAAAIDAMHVRCPHCHDPIEISDADLLSNIECPSCGIHYDLVSDGTTRSHAIEGMKSVGHFELLEVVGVGRFGAVWKARDSRLQRIVALKVPRHSRLSSIDVELFLRDARAAAQLMHPNVVSVHEVGQSDNTLFIASDFIHGANLKEWLAVHRLTAREAAELMLAIAAGVQHAHEQGVVHRDLKPSNIMMDSAGTPRITDFGLAKRDVGDVTMTIEGQILGTPAYMSPEQARGEGHRAGATSDVYSLGVILFEFLTGELPFRGEMRMLILQVIHDEPPSPRKLNARTPRDLETICLKCLEKDPQRRYQSAREFAQDLQRFLMGIPIAARPTPRRVRIWRWCRRYPIVTALSAAVLVALLGGSIVATHFALRANHNARQTTAALYDSLIGQIQALRTERLQGYRGRVSELIAQARHLDTSKVNVNDLVREMSLSMGDFVGYAPTEITHFVDYGSATAIGLSPGAEQLAIGLSSGMIRFYTAQGTPDGEPLDVSPGEIVWLRYSADGRHLDAMSSSGLLRRWSREGGGWTEPRSLRTAVKVTGAGPAAGGQRLVSFGTDPKDASLGVIELWQLDQGTLQATFRFPGQIITGVALSETGSRLAIAYRRQSEVTQVAVAKLSEEGALEIQEELAFELGNLYPNSIALSKDAQKLALGFDERLVIYDLPSQSQTSITVGDAVKAVNFSPNDQILAAADIRGRIILWNSNTNAESARLFNWRQSTSNECLTFSDDGSHLAESNASCVVVWQLDKASEKTALRGHRRGVPCLVWRDDESLATASKDSRVCIWDVERGTVETELNLPGQVQAIAFSPDRTLLAAGYWHVPNEGIQLFHVASRQPLLDDPKHPLDKINALAFFDLKAGRFLAAGGEAGMLVWRVEQDPLHQTVRLEREVAPFGEPVEYLAISPQAKWIGGTAWYEAKYRLRVWDIGAKRLRDLKDPELNQGWHGLAFGEAVDLAAIVSSRGQAEFWNVQTGQKDFALGDPGHFKSPHIALSPDGRWLAGMERSDALEVWDTVRRQRAFSFRPEGNAIWSLAWSPNSQRLATGLSDGSLAVWDLTEIHSELNRLGLSTASAELGRSLTGAAAD